MKKTKAIIIGAGPTGLTAAYELLQKTDIEPIIIEKSAMVGGLAATHAFDDNFVDVGGHRFFTKFDHIKKWWQNFLPLASDEHDDGFILPKKLSRIYYLRHFFDYPVTLNLNTVRSLGLRRFGRIIRSYVAAKLHPRKPQKSAEDFLFNTFGEELYNTFFKDYTEKLWGESCRHISAAWGQERIRGIHWREILLSVINLLRPQKHENFLYPKLGPGQLWQKVAAEIEKQGGKFIFNTEVIGLEQKGHQIKSLTIRGADGQTKKLCGEYFISTAPIKNLLNMIDNVPPRIKKYADGLIYRNFRSAVVLLTKMKPQPILPDTWVYIQENDVQMGRMQVYNNWSPYLPHNRESVMLGFEYFCGDDDDLWQIDSQSFEKLAVAEAAKIGLIDADDVIKTTSFKIEKAYPAYFGTYKYFGHIKKYLDTFTNLYPAGRNGMHKYINMDHAVLCGMAAAENIAQKMPDKNNLWNADIDKYLD